MKNAKVQTIDYTKMELGKVLHIWKGRNIRTVQRCPKCTRRGSRYVSIPTPEDLWKTNTPYVSVDHMVEVVPNPKSVQPFFGTAMRHVKDHCMVKVTKENVDDLLNVEERKRYDAWVAAVRSFVDQF